MTSVPIASSSSERIRIRQQPLIGGKREIDAIVDTVRQSKCCRLIGPRYHHKSQIMREACRAVEKRLGFASLYVSLYDVRAQSNVDFYASIQDWLALKAKRYHHQRLPKLPIKTSSDLTTFLSGLPDAFHSTVVLFVDDLSLDAVPPDYLQELLRVLRAAYQTTVTRLPLIAVVCASNSLARTVLGHTSPFENISKLVSVGDLSRDESRTLAQQLVAERCPNPMPQALELIYQETAGDRFLIGELCAACCRMGKQGGDKRITSRLVKRAMSEMIVQGGQGVLAEGVAHIESNPDLLSVMLTLADQGQIAVGDLPFDPADAPDPLTSSGFAIREGSVFRLKSILHTHLFKHAFPPEHIGRVFLAAGNWDVALAYLEQGIRHGADPAARERVMEATINAMYSTQTHLEAYGYLARGLESAYPRCEFRIYDLDESNNTLVLLHPATATLPNKKNLPDAKLPDPQALDKPEYWWQRNGKNHLTFFFPLNSNKGLGLVIVERFVTRRNLRKQQREIFELVGYLNHASRAIKNRLDYERLLVSANQHAKDLADLLDLTHRFMGMQGGYKRLLDQVLKSALEALDKQAQMGSIYLYDRRTGLLTMQADTGYSDQVRNAARFKPGKGIAGIVYQSGKSLIVNDTGKDAHYAPLPEASPHVYSTMGVPLTGRHGTIGVLCLDNIERTQAFSPDNERLLWLFANQVALWLENVRLMDILADLNRTTIALRELSSSDPQGLLEKLADQLVRHFEMNSCAIGLHQQDQIRFVVQRGLTLASPMPLADLPLKLRQVIAEGEPVSINLRTTRDGSSRWLGQPDLTSLVALPLPEADQQRGIILLGCVGKFSPSDEELELLKTFANQVTIARKNADLYRETRGELAQRVEELVRTNTELAEANKELETARRRDVHYRSARMATGLLHRIKNSVVNIPDLVDEIKAARDPAKMTVLLDELRLSAQSLTEMNKWLQKFVRVGSPSLEWIDLVKLVDQVIKNAHKKRPAHVRIYRQPVQSDGVRIKVDILLIDFLMENLLKNAWEAIPDSREGEIKISIEADDTFCYLRVFDNGGGIPPENQEKIWEWGWTTKAEKPDVHGLGLFVCRDIVASHEGEIKVQASEPDQGTTILVQLPLQGPKITVKG